ncbi:hypothetical protein [Streptomyces boninensis]|uniref:hypothetical protein n=1 Tax=Streptomyces boninensis TaxID=2039455 RepID=UPI003B2144C0
MRRTIPSSIAALTAAGLAALTLAGCGSDDEGKPKAGPEVAWAGSVCDHVSASGARMQLPKTDPKKAQKTQKQMAAFLKSVAEQLGSLQQAMKKDGAPPLKGSQAAYDKAMTNLGSTKQSVTEAASALKGADVSDEKSLRSAMAKVGKGMGKANKYPGVAADLSKDARLKSAFQQAPSCEKVVPRASASAAAEQG